MSKNMKLILASRTAPLIGNLSAYANNFSAIIGDLYAGMDTVSRELTGFIPSAMRAPGVERAAVGQTVDYPIAPEQTAIDIVPSMQLPNPPDNTMGTGQMAITKARAVRFGITGEEQRALNSSGPGYMSVQAMWFAQAVRTLANEVERDGSAEAAKSASRAVGTAGTTPFVTDDLRDLALLKKILDDNGAPETGRSAILNTSAGANLRSVKNLTRVNEAGTQMTLRQGELLDMFGFSIKETGQPTTHTSSGASGVATDTSGYAEKATDITVTGGPPIAGDVISFAGDANKYVVASVAGQVVTIAEPGLRVAIPAQATAVTVSASYAANVAFSMDAMHVAMRPPAIPEGGDAAVDRMLITDPRSGVTFEISMYAGYKMMSAEVGLAWGWKNTKSAHTALLLG